MKEQALQELRAVTNQPLNTLKEAEDYLSERLQEVYIEQDDAQEAFDALDTELNGLLGKYFVYTLSGKDGEWHVGTGDAFDDTKLDDYIEAFQEHYNEEFESLDDLTSKLEYRVMKDMSNAGCDAFNALAMILEEDLLLDGVFAILGADEEPRIEWANFDTI